MKFAFCRHILKEMRIYQWTKNVLVYAALVFSGALFQKDTFLFATQMFFAFSFTASGVYFFNDIFDYETDRRNPKKCHRPIAAGVISRYAGAGWALSLFVAGLWLSYGIRMDCAVIVLSYIVVNLAYTVHWKHVVIIDVLMVAYGFVARAVAGAAAIGSAMTTWFLLCVMFLSLFLALGKRRHELLAFEENRLAEGRKVLEHYSIGFIDQLMTIVTAASLMSYVLFAMDPMTNDSFAMMFTIPLVIYGMFYYLYVVRVKRGGGAPDEVLYKEKPILIVVLLYILFIVIIRNL